MGLRPMKWWRRSSEILADVYNVVRLDAFPMRARSESEQAALRI